MPRQLTDEQEKIITTSQSMLAGESLKIQACAGSGKTSTLVEISKANPNARFLYIAFNKSIVEEAKNKFPDNVEIKTTHALAHASIIAPNKYQVVPKHTFFDLKDILGFKDYDEFFSFNKELNYFLNSDIINYTHPLIDELFEAARRGEIPYTHSMYLKEYQMLSTEQKNLDRYDFILLDEAQDTNGVTLGIFLDNSCKKVVVGDTFQNIYGFRDTVNALEKLKTNFNESLTHSFRCQQNILSKACYFLNEYSEQDKRVWFKSGYEEKQDEVKTKAIITRSNAGIIEMIAKNLTKKDGESPEHYKLIKEPNAIFASSLSCYHFKNNQLDKIHSDYKWIKNFNGIEDLKDFADLTYDVELQKAMELVDKYGEQLFDLFEHAKTLYKTKEFDTYLTNAHISKGLEWNEVVLYEDFPELKDMQSKLNEAIAMNDKKERERLAKSLQGEVNLYYVALTRAKDKVIDRTNNHLEYKHFCASLKNKEEQMLDDEASMDKLRKTRTLPRYANK